MSTAIPIDRIQPPSREDVVQEIRRNVPGIKVYNPGQDWVSPEVFAITYHIPPDLQGQVIPHPVDGRDVVADGHLEIKDRYGLHKGATKVIDAAFDVVVYIVENYAQRGITWLSGTPELDEPRKRAARKIYHSYLRGWAQSELEARDEFMRNWKEKNKDKPIPPPTARQIKAQEFLDMMRLTESERDRQYICTCGHWEGDDWSAYARHMLASHGQHVEKPKDDTLDPAGKRAGPATPVDAALAAAEEKLSKPIDGPVDVIPEPVPIGAPPVPEPVAQELEKTIKSARDARTKKLKAKAKA